MRGGVALKPWMALFGSLLAAFGCTGSGQSRSPQAEDRPTATAGDAGGSALRVLVFFGTRGYVHESIGAGLRALEGLAEARRWALRATDAPEDFTPSALQEFDVVVFLSTTGDVLLDEQQTAFEQFIRSGRGYVGVHSASDTEYDWPWYGALVGAYFSSHPAIQTATLGVENPDHPAAAELPSPWVHTEEWYAFRENPRPNVSVLLHVDETSYSPGDSTMGEDHPIAWAHEYDGGRAFYTALGHTAESYQESAMLAHLRAGVEWAAGR
jgi:cytochrome c